jgi:hypothetical protein
MVSECKYNHQVRNHLVALQVHEAYNYTHIESSLCSNFLSEQQMRDLELKATMGHWFDVDIVFLEAHVPPYSLLHAERQGEEYVAGLYAR